LITFILCLERQVIADVLFADREFENSFISFPDFTSVGTCQKISFRHVV